MSTVRGAKDRRFKFVQLLNSMFEDPEISLKAKGFIGYCLTKTEDWVFHINHLVRMLKEGEKAIYSVINECISHGYAIRYQKRRADGEYAEWETIVSDSKTEIETIKKELEEKGIIQKSFTVACFGDADNGDPEKVPPSNNIPNSNTKKEQQQAEPVSAAVVFSYKEIFSELENIDIAQFEKEQITRCNDRSTVKDAIEWATDPANPPNKCLAASIKFACKMKLKKEKSKEENEQLNKEYAMRYDGRKTKTTEISCLNKHIEIIQHGACNPGIYLEYGIKDFMNKFNELLKLNKFNLIGEYAS